MGHYECPKQKAWEFKSGAYILVIVGFLGLIFVALLLSDVLLIRINYSSRYMISGVMGALFILFIIMGLLSFRSSKTYITRAKDENSLREALKNWCAKNITLADIDGEDMPDQEELVYFYRTNRIKELISKDFLNIDPDYLDDFIDNFYCEMFQ